MKYLSKNPDFEIVQFDIHKKTDWMWVAEHVDIIFFNYLHNPWGYAAMGAMARKNGVKMVIDLDDSLWDISEDNPAYKVFYPKSEALMNFNAILKDVDYVTTTSSYLKNVIVHNALIRHDKIHVIPNYIDLELYKHRAKFRQAPDIVISHFGSTTHFNDLANDRFAQGMDMVMKKYPTVRLKTIGAMIGDFKERWGMRYYNDYGHQDIYHWIQDEDRFSKFMDETDIMVTPLVENVYNRCKSQIKFLEVSSAKIPGVWEKIRQYEEVVDGKNGLLAHSAQDWYEAIEKLILDENLRKTMGREAYNTVKKDWTIQGNINRYVDLFKSIV